MATCACLCSEKGCEKCCYCGRNLIHKNPSPIRIGDYDITEHVETVWIQHVSGEGMETNRKKFSDHMIKAIAKYFKENF